MSTITPLSEHQVSTLRRWTETTAPAFYASRPEVTYRRGEGLLPDVHDFVDGIALPLLRSLKVRALFRDHDGALLALRPSREDGVLTQYPRRSLADYLLEVTFALPAPSATPIDRELADAVKLLSSKPHDRFVWAALTHALERLDGEAPIDLDVDNVRLTPRRAATRPAKTPQREHLDLFLRTVPLGEHRTATVVAEYRAAAERSNVTPIGRTTFLRLADLELGPRLSIPAGQVYRVRAPHVEEFDLEGLLGFRPAPLTDDTRTALRAALQRR